MHNPVEVEIAVSKPAENIQQSVFICRESDKTVVLRQVFREHPPKRVILFASSKQKVKELAIVLKRHGLNARAMHSDLSQPERDEVMQLFRAHQVDLLVATDIVARGIDIDDITMVINYDAPHDAEDYVHRIGRTARAGREGSAITLIGEKDLYALSNIERTLKIRIPRAELPEGVRPPAERSEADAARKGGKGHRGGGNKGGGHHGSNRSASNGKPANGKPSNGKPSNGKPANSKPSKGRSRKPTNTKPHGDRPRREHKPAANQPKASRD